MTELLTALAEIAEIGQGVAIASILVFLRVGAALALLPAYGENSVPQRLRLIIALAFTAIVTPAVATEMPNLTLLVAGSEIFAGLALGAVFRLFILTLQITGTIIAQATSLSQIAGNAAPEPQPAIGHLLTAAGLAIAVMAGLHVKLAEVLILSYRAFPAGNLPTKAEFATWGLAHIGHAFSLGFSLAAPFTIAALMYNLALGAINRAMPALMVSFIGAPALSWGGLVLISTLAPALLGVWSGVLQTFLESPFEVPQ